MRRLQTVYATAILIVWVVICAAAIHDTRVIPLATVATPVMLLPAGWLFTDDFIRSRKERRRDPELEDDGSDDRRRRQIKR